ncbi:AAA family ATPase [Sedimentibacter sp.]|uniref:nucleotide-binding protein n=1 Tax=Sedimentibacter sp. TaxID=1960295 RepID=UPI0028A2B1E5|nr:AAA family ATPase [Sedimentibacter sp.]
MGKVIAVSSQKEDIGKTIIGIKTGIKLSQSGKNVLLMDFSSGKKKMSEYLKVNENIIYDIKDVLDSTCSLELASIEIKEGLSLLPCPRINNKLGKVKKESFVKIISEAKKDYDVIILDVDKIQLSYVDFSVLDNVIIINNNDFSCIKEINTDKAIAERYKFNNIYVLINKYDIKKSSKGTMMKLKDIQKLSDAKIQSTIEENIKYCEADYDFLFGTEDSTFNRAVDSIIKNI